MTTLSVGHTYVVTSPNKTFSNTRTYMKFDMSSQGLAVGDVASVQLRMYCTAVSGGSQNVHCRSSQTGFGTTLEATEADYLSTSTNIEGELDIGSTGYHYFDINKNNLTFSSWNYFRLASHAENSTGANQSLTFGSQTNSTTAYRPLLIFTLSSGAYVYVWSCVC